MSRQRAQAPNPDATQERPGSDRSEQQARDDEDAAAVIAVLVALTADHGDAEAARPRELWGSPAARLGLPEVGPHAWWASGLTR